MADYKKITGGETPKLHHIPDDLMKVFERDVQVDMAGYDSVDITAGTADAGEPNCVQFNATYERPYPTFVKVSERKISDTVSERCISKRYIGREYGNIDSVYRMFQVDECVQEYKQTGQTSAVYTKTNESESLSLPDFKYDTVTFPSLALFKSLLICLDAQEAKKPAAEVQQKATGQLLRPRYWETDGSISYERAEQKNTQQPLLRPRHW